MIFIQPTKKFKNIFKSKMKNSFISEKLKKIVSSVKFVSKILVSNS